MDDILTHLGENRDEYFQAISPPIIQTSNFYFKSIEEFRDKILTEKTSHVYTRGNNPTVKILRQKLAALEKTEDALVTSSGAAAVALAILANVKHGDHIVCVQSPYSWTFKLLNEMLPKFGVTTTFVDGKDNNEIENAILDNTKILYLESPNSLLFDLQDLEYCGQLCKNKGLISIIDNSYCSPIFQNPIEYGIDIIVHSGTKYLNGHSDVVCGAIMSSNDHIDKIFHSTFMTLGAIISPHDAWLILRGLRTLTMRIERSNETAGNLVKMLHNHPKIEKVIFPFHPSFPQYNLALKQMNGCGGLFTLILKAKTKVEVYNFVNSIQHIMMGVSWGGYESLMVPSIVFHDMPGRPDSNVPWNYIRMYTGLESYEFLASDIKEALAKM
jgi:cystathionine beta-lyase/cystathionine gamma-synthase